jgi:hypothetical protein
MKVWIARNKSGYLGLHSTKPEISVQGNFGSEYYNLAIAEGLFPEVTYENSPQEYELTDIIKPQKLSIEQRLDHAEKETGKLKRKIAKITASIIACNPDQLRNAIDLSKIKY